MISILLVDDHVIVRSGLAAYISEEMDLCVAAEAGSVAEAIQTLDTNPELQVAVIDLRLPDGTGIDCLKHIAEKHPNLATLILSVNAGENDIIQAVDAGARGYLSKSADQEELIDAIRTVAEGGTYFPAFIQRKLDAGSARPKLTEREQRILEQLVSGASNKEIADRLNIADVTVRQHMSAILRKLGAQDRTQAALLAVREGHVRVEE